MGFSTTFFKVLGQLFVGNLNHCFLSTVPGFE